jgi:protocatechuate 3,4-dioxygenase beta subunit
MSEDNGSASRRGLIKASVGLAATAACAPASPVVAQTAGASCSVSSLTEAGPFYPTEAIPQRWDLTAANRPAGQLLYITGIVRGRDCAPAADTIVEFWQTDANGNYNHPRAENTQPLDPNFHYFGQWPTRADGAYLVKTVVPAPYRFRGLRRAPHIHFTFTHADRGSLTTELYFNRPADVRQRTDDRVWSTRDSRTRDSMIVDLNASSSWPYPEHPTEADSLWCRYDVTLA